MKNKKLAVNSGIFVLVMILTFWSVFRGQNPGEIAGYIGKMTFPSAAAAVVLAVAFVLGEGCMICYLLKGLGEKTTLCHCAGYSFIGFFFSGLTPSATGGQPVQLYYMKKDGIEVASSSVVLMTVAVLYKFVLVLIGAGIYLLWRRPLKRYLQGYYWLYFLGLFLNLLLVILLLMVMFRPQIIKVILVKTEKILVRLKLLKPSENREKKMEQFLMRYHETVQFFKCHKKIIGITTVGTFLQRSCIFALTYAVYAGMGLKEIDAVTILLLQAAISVAVDMLPLPGAQGITEAMYRAVFYRVFPGQYLIASMCITRGISFYLIMIIAFFVWSMRQFEVFLHK